MPKLNQRGVVHFLLPLILLLGIIAGVWLITNGNPLKLFSRAGGAPIWFTDVNGKTLPVKNNIPQTTSPKVRIELYSTLGPPLKSISSPVSFKTSLVNSVYAQENTTCPGGCADSQGNGANGLKCDPQSWTRKDYTQCTSTGTYYYCYSSCSTSSSSSPPPVQDTKSCPGGSTACGGTDRDNLGLCSTSWSYPGNTDWNNWCLKNAGGADAYCYSCSVPTPTSPPTPTTPPKCPGSCGNSDRSGLGQCIGGWEYTPKYNDSCGVQKYCYVCDDQIQNPTPPPPPPSPIPQPPDAPPVGQPPPPPDIPVPQPTNPPEPTPGVRYTTSYRIAENPTDLAQAPWLNYTEEPTIVNKYSGGVYEFKDQTLGIKFFWVEFKANDGSIDRKSAQIEIVASPTPIPTPPPFPTPTPTPTPQACNLGIFVKFKDVTSNGPDKFVDLSLKQPGTSTELWKFNSVPATTNTSPYFTNNNKDLYRIGIGNVSCGTYDIYLNSSGYQEKKFANILVDGNSGNDPELWLFGNEIVPSFKRVFVTSTTYNGNLGGLSGADQKCQARANATNLGGNWKAWLSDDTTTAASRLNHSVVPYKLLNGKAIADDWNDLVTADFKNVLGSIINIYETGKAWVQSDGSYLAWTGTNLQGSNRQGNTVSGATLLNCNNWTSEIYSSQGRIGSTQNILSWTDADSSFCSDNVRLYCFEQ